MTALLWLLPLAYLVGSVPTGLWIVRALKGVDLRRYGSGNLGATNAARLIGWRWGIFVILLDAAKGAIGVWLTYGQSLPGSETDPLLAPALGGLAALLGHLYPLFAGFRGGKGVATAAGVTLALTPLSALVALGVFLPVLFVGRFMFLASLSGGVAYGLASLLLFPRGPIASLLAIVLPLTLLLKHRANIARFRRGEESRIGRRIRIEEEKE